MTAIYNRVTRVDNGYCFFSAGYCTAFSVWDDIINAIAAEFMVWPNQIASIEFDTEEESEYFGTPEGFTIDGRVVALLECTWND